MVEQAIFWAFVGKQTKGKYKSIVSLKSNAGVSVTSMQGEGGIAEAL